MFSFFVDQQIGGELQHLRFSVEVTHVLWTSLQPPPWTLLLLAWHMTSMSSTSHDELPIFMLSNAKVNRELRFEKVNHL